MTFYNKTENDYKPRRHKDLKTPFFDLVYDCSKSISYLCRNICDIVPSKLRKKFLLTASKSQSENR